MAFSLATAGCNVNCKMCQNWDISQVRPEQVRATYVPPRRDRRFSRKQYQCPVIAYTYSEPVVFFEYVLDAAEAGRAAGVRSVVVSGGYIQPDPLKKLCAPVDAIKMDLKGLFRKVLQGSREWRAQAGAGSLVTIRKAGVWNEIVYLVIPTLNDGDAEFRAWRAG